MATNPLRSSQLVPAPDIEEQESPSSPRGALRSVDSARAPVGSGRNSSTIPASSQTQNAQVTQVFQATLTDRSQTATSQLPPQDFQTRFQPGSRK